MVELKTILVKYAQERGGGLPLSAQEICNAVVLWCQEYTQEQLGVSKDYVDEQINANKITADTLMGLIEGSETIVVDLNENGDKLEVHLDSETVAEISRALKLPIATPTEDMLVGVDETNSQKMYKLGSNLYVDGDEVNSVRGYFHELIISERDNVGSLQKQFICHIELTTPDPLSIENLLAIGNFNVNASYFSLASTLSSPLIPQRIYVVGSTLRIVYLSLQSYALEDVLINNPTISDRVVAV